LKKNLIDNHLLAITIGVIYLWFGSLKYFPGFSPAEEIAKKTIDVITFGLIPSNVSVILLAIWETTIGIFLLLNIYRKQVAIIALIHITLTFTPLFLFPKELFLEIPFKLTFMGQYIFKNLVIVGGLVSIYNQTLIAKEA
jgi:uncharacterized membrane protein YphA (DoxX/SURF4 family)